MDITQAYTIILFFSASFCVILMPFDTLSLKIPLLPLLLKVFPQNGNEPRRKVAQKI